METEKSKNRSKSKSKSKSMKIQETYSSRGVLSEDIQRDLLPLRLQYPNPSKKNLNISAEILKHENLRKMEIVLP